MKAEGPVKFIRPTQTIFTYIYAGGTTYGYQSRDQ
jgi:hypothetical protein